ncbi:MAG: hypothetical protein ABR498_00600 [Candidatus Dormibacteria bacterium]
MAITRAAMPFPVVPGKTLEDLRGPGKRFEAEPDAWAESRRRVGVTLERVYFQETPMGNFIIAYVESSRPLADVLSGPGRSDLEIDRWFAEQVKELHGVDLSQPPQGPAPEQVGEWVDPAVTQTKRGFAFCAPFVAEMLDKGRAWAAETFASEGMTESRRRLGESKEIVTLFHTPNGPVTGIYLEGDDPIAANRKFTESQEPFDVDFRNMLKQLFPPFVNFDQPVPGITEIFDSQKLPVSV